VKRKRLLLPTFAAVLICTAGASTLAAASSTPLRGAHQAKHLRKPLTQRLAPRRRHVNAAVVRRLQRSVWRGQALMGVRRARSAAPLRTQRALRYWRGQARRTSWLVAHPPHKRGWLCIHRFEGSWGDSGDPYWGGLQMDRSFMRTYAPAALLRRGWANRWTPLEQMWVAERAHRSGRGYWPWPNTARYCGLI
jgi:hypothetical protein